MDAMVQNAGIVDSFGVCIKLAWQGITFLSSGIELSTPASVDIQ